MQAVACNFCEADDAALLFSGRDRAFADNQQTYQMRQCRRCGLVYLSPRPSTPEELAAIYPSAYAPYMKPGQRLVLALRRLAWRAELDEIVRLTHPESTILEIGSATGEFLAALRERGRPRVRGLEFSAEAAASARERYDLDVQAGDLRAQAMPVGSVDAVVMRHVFEHLTHPLETLGEVGRILRPGGSCIITIPNVDSHLRRLFGDAWYGWDIPRHFYLFPRPTLEQMAARAGLQLVAVRQLAVPNSWIGSLRYWLQGRGQTALGRFVRYQNPLALALFAPLGLASALAGSSGIIRVILRAKGQA